MFYFTKVGYYNAVIGNSIHRISQAFFEAFKQTVAALRIIIMHFTFFKFLVQGKFLSINFFLF